MELFFLSCFPSDISLLSQWRMGQWRDGNKATKMCPRYYQCSIWRTLLLSSLYFSFLDFQLIGRILKPVYCSVHSHRGGSMTWPSCTWCLFTPSKPQFLTGKVQDSGGGDSTLLKVQSQLRQWFGLYKYTGTLKDKAQGIYYPRGGYKEYEAKFFSVGHRNKRQW